MASYQNFSGRKSNKIREVKIFGTLNEQGKCTMGASIQDFFKIDSCLWHSWNFLMSYFSATQ